MPAYQFSTATGSGTYITDAATIAEAQAELSLHYCMRPVTVTQESKKSPDRSGANSPGVGEDENGAGGEARTRDN